MGVVVGAPLWEATTEDVVWVKGDGAEEAGVGHHRELGCRIYCWLRLIIVCCLRSCVVSIFLCSFDKVTLRKELEKIVKCMIDDFYEPEKNGLIYREG